MAKSLNCEVLPYIDGSRLAPESYVPLLIDVIRRFYIRRGIFAESMSSA